MKTILLATMILFGINVSAQKTNLDKLPEKERNEYLLKTAYETVMKHAPEWHRDYKEPEIRSFVIEGGDDNGRLRYSVGYLYDPQKEKMECTKYSVEVGIYADTGEVADLFFGDGLGYIFPPKRQSSSPIELQSAEKPFYRPYPYKNE